MYQVLPVGVFQPAGEEPWNTSNDFSLWRCIIRELAEELGGNADDYDTHRGPIDYDAWPFAPFRMFASPTRRTTTIVHPEFYGVIGGKRVQFDFSGGEVLRPIDEPGQ